LAIAPFRDIAQAEAVCGPCREFGARQGYARLRACRGHHLSRCFYWLCYNEAMVKDYRKTWRNWPERHAGLGGWFGAVGAILAILAAWQISRGEYFRTQSIENERVNKEISLIDRTASQFDPLVRQCIKLAREHSSEARGFYQKHNNDPAYSRMVDFGNMRISQWPSVEAYDAFKEYWIASLGVMQTAADTTDTPMIEERIRSYDGKLEDLQKALNAARPH
jgi:hypothetical protein